jgi:P4 family phage/plasmid primase-like protien
MNKNKINRLYYKMDPTIKKLVTMYPTKGRGAHTHVCMGAYKGSMTVGRHQFKNVWDTYQKTIHDNPTAVSGIAERPQKYSQVRGDIDIKLLETEECQYGNKIHTTKHVMGVIKAYQDAIEETVSGCTEEQLTCVYLNKPLYRVKRGDKTYAKHGFHIQFPYLFLGSAEQRVHITPRVKEALKKQELFADIGVEDSSTMIDTSVTTVPWLLHGSCKNIGMDSYSVCKIFARKLGEDKDITEVSIFDSFVHYKLFDFKERRIDLSTSKAIEYNMPRILSILPFGRKAGFMYPNLSSPIKEELYRKKALKREYTVKTSLENLNTAKALLPLLADFRADDRNEWMTIGWCLFSISDGLPEGYEMWRQFSQRNSKYDETSCMDAWNHMEKRDVTMGTLMYFASIDSPAEFMAFKAAQASKYVHQSMSGSHNDIAQVLFAEYGNEFVCASVSGKIWFQFIDHHWEQIEDGIFLRKKISGELVDLYTQQGKDILDKMAKSSENSAEEDMLNSRRKALHKMIKQLRNSSFKNNVMKEACEVFYDKNFAAKLNTNPMIFPVKNGVFDLKLDVFREGRPEDYYSTASPVSYYEFDENDEAVGDVFDFLSKVFPNPGIRRYFMDVASDLFHGGNKQKEVYMCTGDGDNGKSVTQCIIEKMLGKFSIKFNTTVVTGKKVNSGAANPELARAGNGVRLGTIEEPNNDETINIGILKNLSGNDSFYARDLFEKGKDGREIQPMFKIFFICNELPDLKHSDKAIWGRMRVIPFEAIFCRPDDPAPLDPEEQMRQKRFPMDKEFGSKIEAMLPAFMWVLLRHRRSVAVGADRVTPPEVMAATKHYQEKNDIYAQFCGDSLIEEDGQYMSGNELYSQFKVWFKECKPYGILPSRVDVEVAMVPFCGKPSRKKFIGWRLRTTRDDDDELEAMGVKARPVLQEDETDYNKPNKRISPVKTKPIETHECTLESDSDLGDLPNM